jgi:uncharacterized membrane protein YeaQ/YmgE (transglycosylase-associated protein family)
VDQKTRDLLMMGAIGLIAGYLASVVLGGSGLIRYLLSGLIGALVGPLVLGLAGVNLGLRPAIVNQIATATIGAIVVVLLARLIG